MRAVLSGTHVIIYSRDAEADRAFLRDVLGLGHVDAGHGWLIFALPPAEVAVHPTDEQPRHEVYLMCDDLDATVKDLETKGVPIVGAATQLGWGARVVIGLPSGAELAIYQPRHPTAHRQQ